mgnify:CR=1 FL=1
MDFDYEITLERPSYKAVNTISVFLILLFLVTFIYTLILKGITAYNMPLLLVPVIILFLMFRGFLQRKNPEFITMYKVELYICAIGWFASSQNTPFMILGILYAILGAAEKYIKAPQKWFFNDKEITRKQLNVKKYQWVEVENVVIRDNLFTLDLRTNEIIQNKLETTIDKSLEAEFNNWAKQQIHFKA